MTLNRKSRSIAVICRSCDRSFRVKQSRLNRGGGKFCSRICAGAAARKQRHPRIGMVLDRSKPAILYQITNLINGKRYIGVTTGTLFRRRSTHFLAAKKGATTVLARAIRKYGEASFRFSTIQTYKDMEAAFLAERHFIALWRPEYNLTAGGEGIVGYRHTEEAKAKIAAGSRSWKRSPELFQKVVATKKARGIKPIQDAKNIAAFGAGRQAASQRRKKQVICLSDGMVFESCAKAAEHYGVSRAMMTHAVKGTAATATGRIFSYYTGVESALPDPVDEVTKIRSRQKSLMLKNTPRRRVYCETDGRVYPSVRAAAVAYGVHMVSISRVLTGARKTILGHKFHYADQTEAE